MWLCVLSGWLFEQNPGEALIATVKPCMQNNLTPYRFYVEPDTLTSHN